MHVAMQKYWKKRREKKYKKWTSVQENKTMGNLKPEKKEMNKIAHVFLQSILQFLSREVCFQGAILELGLATIYTYHISTIFHTYAHLDLIV
jgi:hypothetical protein